MGKRRKNYYVDKSNLKKKRFDFSISEKLAAGVCGFLISHDRGKEKRCIQESLQLLNHFAEMWYGAFKEMPKFADVKYYETVNGKTHTLSSLPNNENPVRDNESESEDIELALSKEVKELQQSVKSNQEKYRFNAVKTGCNNLIFIKSKDIQPSLFIQKISQDLFQAKKALFVTPTVLKIHPADVSCKAHLQDMKCELENYLPNAFDKLLQLYPDCNDLTKEFTIIYRHRNNDNVSRNDVYEVVTTVISDIGCLWKYNCRSNTFFLIIEVLKAVCLIGVSIKYTKHKKLNIKELQLNKIIECSKSENNESEKNQS